MPKELIEGLFGKQIAAVRIAQFVWDRGVSVAALANRISKFEYEIPSFLLEHDQTIATQKFLGEHLQEIGLTWADVQCRASLSGAQRFPSPVLAALYEQVNRGKVPAGIYEWALG